MKTDDYQNLSDLLTDDEKEVGVATRSQTSVKKVARKRRIRPKLSDNAAKRGATFAESMQSNLLKTNTSDRNRREKLEKERAERVRKVSNSSMISPL